MREAGPGIVNRKNYPYGLILEFHIGQHASVACLKPPPLLLSPSHLTIAASCSPPCSLLCIFFSGIFPAYVVGVLIHSCLLFLLLLFCPSFVSWFVFSFSFASQLKFSLRKITSRNPLSYHPSNLATDYCLSSVCILNHGLYFPHFSTHPVVQSIHQP